MTSGLTYAKLPHDQKVLVVGVVSGNLGDYLENHPRVEWWHRDKLFRHTDGYPAGVGRVFITKFIPHAFQGRLNKWNEALEHHARKGQWVPHIVSGFGSTSELKRLIYQSLGEHHPKHNPTETEKAQQAAIGNRGPATVMEAAFIKAAVDPTLAQSTLDRANRASAGGPARADAGGPARADADDLRIRSAAPEPAPPYKNLAEWLEQFWPWDDAGPDTDKARALYSAAIENGLTKATKESFVTIATKWAREHRPAHVAAVAKRDVAVEAVLEKRQVLPRQPDPELEKSLMPPVDGRAKERPTDTTASDAKALLALVDEAIAKAHEVVSTLEIVKSSLPGLVEGLEAKEQRIERAIAALRNL